MRIKTIPVVLLAICLCAGAFFATNTGRMQGYALEQANAVRQVTDMRGKMVIVPNNPQRVAVFDKGFLLQCMAAMRVTNKLALTGGLAEAPEERQDIIFLCPQILELPHAGYPGEGVDYEALRAVKPDLVLLRRYDTLHNSEETQELINTLEEWNIPLVVLDAPAFNEEGTVETQYQGIRLLGEVFGVKERAEEVRWLMNRYINEVEGRTENSAEKDAKPAAYLTVTAGGSAAEVWGRDFGSARFAFLHANIQNALTVSRCATMSSEEIAAMNPGAIILCPGFAEANPLAILQNPAFSGVEAVQNKRVVSVGTLTRDGDFGIEIASVLMISAKNAYPKDFEDIPLYDWLNDYHRALYGITVEEAEQLKALQGLSWMDEIGF